jgi:arylsulfatase A-like enzyme
MADRWLGRFLEKMDDLNLFENTLIIILSDHGHALGEHKIVGKPVQALWPELTDIVFFLRHPEGKGAGQTSDYYASTHDVAPTILSLLGIQPPVPMDGQDLSVILDRGKPESRDHFSLGYHNFVWARDEAHVYFSRNDGTKAKLYDVRVDPKMRNNRAADRPEVAKRMFEDYVLEDAGGPLPRYRTPLPSAELVLYSPRLAAIALSRRLTLRAALFGWIMPLVAALLYSRWDSSLILRASSSFPECTAL